MSGDSKRLHSKRLHAEASEGTRHLQMNGYVETWYPPEDMQTWRLTLSQLGYRTSAYMYPLRIVACQELASSRVSSDTLCGIVGRTEIKCIQLRPLHVRLNAISTCRTHERKMPGHANITKMWMYESSCWCLSNVHTVHSIG